MYWKNLNAGEFYCGLYDGTGHCVGVVFYRGDEKQYLVSAWYVDGIKFIPFPSLDEAKLAVERRFSNLHYPKHDLDTSLRPPCCYQQLA
jgi:hypothetical protein